MEAASAAAGVHGSRALRARPAAVLRLMSDDRLVALAQDGSEPAFETLVHRHRAPLLGFCTHLLGSTAEADDAVQHTLVAAYRMIGSRRPLQLRPWLYRVARNRCLSVLRARRAVGPMPRDLPSEHLSAQVERREDLRDLLADIARLPEPQRAARVLAEGCGFRHDEIALVLGCRREKVKGLVFQARSTLLMERGARDASCQAVREQLATNESRGLRPALVRRHLRHC